jgi:hypothetical protein
MNQSVRWIWCSACVSLGFVAFHTLHALQNVTMDSDKALCVRMEMGDQKTLQIISLATGSVINKFPMPAESAILSPDTKTIAVRGTHSAA